jgi:hypothetical protein
MRPLPEERFADYAPLVVLVRSTSKIEVPSVSYSVHSLLIGHPLTGYLRYVRPKLFLSIHFAETLPRLHS